MDISPQLTNDQRSALEKIILQNELTFGLDGRLGNYPEKVEVSMKPGTIPISLPPFPASPAKREVIDKQMDSWIELGVIEPSVSPWAAPVFIVYRNGKPRMVIDLRKFNENVIPDEFPLHQEKHFCSKRLQGRLRSVLGRLGCSGRQVYSGIFRIKSIISGLLRML